MRLYFWCACIRYIIARSKFLYSIYLFVAFAKILIYVRFSDIKNELVNWTFVFYSIFCIDHKSGGTGISNSLIQWILKHRYYTIYISKLDCNTLEIDHLISCKNIQIFAHKILLASKAVKDFPFRMSDL